MHMPGHKGGPGASALARSLLGQAAFHADVSEMGGYDYLHAPEGALAEAQAAAAALFGAEQTFFLVNGSTVGNQAAILACCGDGDALVMLRGSHRSVYAGAMLAGAVPSYVPMEYDVERDGWFLGDVSALTSLADRSRPSGLSGLTGPLGPFGGRLAAVHVTRPNYYGMAADLAPWVEFAHERGVPLIVDEAHGSHFGFDSRLPASALSLGADIVIQSTHKTLGALTQASMLHVGIGAGGRVDAGRIARALQMLQSSSPSALLTISLDLARDALETAGAAALDGVIDLAQTLRGAAALLPGFSPVRTDDLTKVVIDVAGTGRSGFAVAVALRSEEGVWVELADFRRIVLSITAGDDSDSVAIVAEALRRVHARGSSEATVPNATVAANAPSAPAAPDPDRPLPSMPLPAMVVPLRRAERAPDEVVGLGRAVGRVVAEFVIPYPPGIPLVVPGERIDNEVLAALARFIEAGCRIVGPHDPTLGTLRVILE